jgi:hypothetical protein
LSSRTTDLETTSSVLVGASASFSSILTSVSSSQQQISASLLNVIAIGATTGSNSFRADQSITGSLVVSSTITAQTLVVQTVTSSIVYSSGSNNFGNQLANTQTFTGSVNITGSLIVNTTGTEFQVNNNGVVMGNLLTDNHSVTGSLRVTGSGNHSIMGSNLGIGNVSPTVRLQVSGTFAVGDENNGWGRIIFDSATNATRIQSSKNGTDSVGLSFWTQASGGGFSERLVISGSNVGIGTNSPSQKLEVSGSIKATNTIVMGSPFMFRNKIHNGDMRIDQRYNGSGISNVNGAWGVDRFITYISDGSAWSFQRSTTAPPGFMNSLLITSTTGGSIGAGSYSSIRHSIEGINVYDLAWGTSSAKNITVSFWVRSSVTGNYGFAIRNGSNNYGYVASYTISSANTWTYITLNIPGPTTGTWTTSTNPSLVCMWDLGAGTSYSQAAGSWISASEIIGLTGGVKFITNSSATYYLTGVQLEIGDVATPFETRPYSTELSLCERYLRMIANGNDETVLGGWSFSSTTQMETDYMSPIQMRIAPSLTQTATVYRVNSAGLNNNFTSAVSTIIAGISGGRLRFDLTGATAGQGAVIRVYQNGGYIALTSEI